MGFIKFLKDRFTPERKERDDLLPCPFCKGKLLSTTRNSGMYDFPNVICESCGAVGPRGVYSFEAETLWDERVDQSERKGSVKVGLKNILVDNCLFCGYDYVSIYTNRSAKGFRVECYNCDAMGPGGKTREEAADIWNNGEIKNEETKI